MLAEFEWASIVKKIIISGVATDLEMGLIYPLDEMKLGQ